MGKSHCLTKISKELNYTVHTQMAIIGTFKKINVYLPLIKRIFTAVSQGKFTYIVK